MSSSDPIIFYDIASGPHSPVRTQPMEGPVDLGLDPVRFFSNGEPLFGKSIGLYAACNAQMDTTFTTGAALCAETFPFNPETAEKSKAEFCRRSGVKTWDELVVRGEKRKLILDALGVAMGEAAKYFRFSDGPLIGGKEADYADIIIGGWLMLLSNSVPEWKEIREWHGGLWGRLHDALEPYRGTW